MTRANFVKLLQDAKTLVDEHRPVGAILLIKKATGCDILKAKAAVERLRRLHPSQLR